MNTLTSIGKAHKKKVFNRLMLAWNIVKFILVVAFATYVFGGAFGATNNHVNTQLISEFGFRGNLIDTWNNDLSMDGFFKFLVSVIVILLAIALQLMLFGEAIEALDRYVFRRLIFQRASDKVILRYFSSRIKRRKINTLSLNSGKDSDSLSKAEIAHWEQWKKHYKSDMSFAEWKEKVMK